MIDRTNYLTVRSSIEDGDVAAFLGDSWISRNGGGPCYHFGILQWNRQGTETDSRGELSIIQARMFKYAGVTRLSDEVRRFPGTVCILRPRCPAYIRRQAAMIAYDEAIDSVEYGYGGVLRTSLLRAPLLHMLFGRGIDPDEPGLSPPLSPKFCSQLVEWSYRKAGFPLVSERIHDAFVDPNLLWHSALLELKFPGLEMPRSIKVAA